MLVVEDEFLIRMGLSDDLADLGFETDEASNGMQALEKLRANCYAAIFLDLNLPDRDGMDLLADIRRDCAELPVILVSGDSSKTLEGAHRRFPRVATIQKPFSVGDIQKALTVVDVGGPPSGSLAR